MFPYKGISEQKNGNIWIRARIQTPSDVSLAFFFFFRPHLQYMDVPRLGSNQSRPAPQPQQCQIQALSATYTTAYGNDQGVPWIEPTSSWILVRFITTEPQWELHLLPF